MSELTNERKREIEGLAEFMGWAHKPFNGGIIVKRDGKWFTFDPFADLHSARFLLVECNKRGLMGLVAVALRKRLTRPVWCKDSEFDDAAEVESTAQALLSTAEQQTLAVWEVIEKLNKDKGGA